MTGAAVLSALVFLFSVIYAQAFVITYPTSEGWNKNAGPVTVSWSTSPPDPPVFSIVLRDVGTGSVVNPLAIANNVRSTLWTLDINLPPLPLSETYQIMFVDAASLRTVLANSSVFPIFSAPLSTVTEFVTETTFSFSPTSQAATISNTTSISWSSTSISTGSSSFPPSSTSVPPSSISIPPSSTSVPSDSARTSLTSTSTLPSSGSTIQTTSNSLQTSATITLIATVTVSPQPDATFVPINDARRCRNGEAWVGVFIGAMGFLASALSVL